MIIDLIFKTPDSLKAVYVAARTCYSADTPNNMFKKDTPKIEKLRLLKHILTNKHLSVTEHCFMTFAVSGVSRTLLAQLTRHRIGISFSVQSQRYVSEETAKNDGNFFAYVTPDTIKKNEDALIEYQETMNILQHSYDRLISLGIPKQDARFVLPGGICTNLVISFNLRSFLDVYEKRVLKKGAQWEIKKMLIRMRDLLVEQEPWLDEYLPK